MKTQIIKVGESGHIVIKPRKGKRPVLVDVFPGIPSPAQGRRMLPRHLYSFTPR